MQNVHNLNLSMDFIFSSFNPRLTRVGCCKYWDTDEHGYWKIWPAALELVVYCTLWVVSWINRRHTRTDADSFFLTASLLLLGVVCCLITIFFAVNLINQST